MRKPVLFLIIILLGATGWIFFKNVDVDNLASSNQPVESGTGEIASSSQTPNGANTLDGWASSVLEMFTPDEGQDAANTAHSNDADRVIRLATFNVNALNETKARKPETMDILSRIGRRFDVLAIQEIHSEVDDIVPRLVDLMNKLGGEYDYAVGPRLGPKGSKEQYAFIFNCRTVLLDRDELYTIEDQDDLMLREPFVAWFRAVGPHESEAFTFSLINVRIDPSNGGMERELLDDIIRAVREDGREEDDIILAGDFRSNAGNIGTLDDLANVAYAVSQTPTNTRGDQAWSNIVIQKNATIEFTGRSGVFDFLREYNLNLDEAMEISDHLPVWAEFSIYEGGQAGRIATEVSDSDLKRRL